MPRALPVAIRQAIIDRHQAGQDLAHIALDLHLSCDTVSKLWRRFRERGEACLRPDDQHCGQVGPRAKARMLHRACWLKRHHPTWGGGLIRVILTQRWPE